MLNKIQLINFKYIFSKSKKRFRAKNKFLTTISLDINRIDPFLESLDDFETNLFYAALDNLFDRSNLLRINNFAYVIRELINIYIDRNAPDNFIRQSSWLTDIDNRPYRKDKIRYLIQRNIPNNTLEDVDVALPIQIDELSIEFNDIYKKLNKLTHIDRETLNYDLTQGIKYIQQLMISLDDLFSQINELKISLQECLCNYIINHLFDEITGKAIDAIDICSTHHFVEDVNIDSINVKEIDHTHIHFTGVGLISVEQQYGSNSDIRNGDGAITNTDFPFTFNGSILNTNFSQVFIDNCDVDNDFFFEIDKSKKYKFQKTTMNFLRSIFKFHLALKNLFLNKNKHF